MAMAFGRRVFTIPGTILNVIICIIYDIFGLKKLTYKMLFSIKKLCKYLLSQNDGHI
jgi:hypothetical protein